MDGPSVDHSDSDSGESWTLLENNSVSADESPEFIEEHENRQQSQHHEKDDDTDGISIISDSDHEPLSPLNETVFEKYQAQDSNLTDKEISEYVSVDPQLSRCKSEDHEPAINEELRRYNETKHKTYVHRRNKRLSTVLNIIVLGSVITAAGVAIGHMWGARYDCTMQTTSSVNKILSNLYKLQEENAYLRSKLKELAFINNNQMHQHKIPSKHNKCKKVFEEALNNNVHKKSTKCVDENYDNADNLMEHLMKPRVEKEFIADIDKLKTVYLQNKSWLDGEISRRIKIEEELLKKYNDEVNFAKELKKDVPDTNGALLRFSDTKLHKQKTVEKFVDEKQLLADNFVENKATDIDSTDFLKTEQKPRFRRNEERYETAEENSWLKSKEDLDLVNEDIQLNPANNDQFTPEKKSVINEGLGVANSNDFLTKSMQNNNINDNLEEQPIFDNDWMEIKSEYRHKEERYETEHDNSFLKPKENNFNIHEEKLTYNNDKENTYNRDGVRYVIDENGWLKNAQEPKNMRKKEKHDTIKNEGKQRSESKKNASNGHRIPEFGVGDEDFIINNRYVINKLKQENKKNEYVQTNKKQKRKNKFEKWDMKGELGEKFEPVEIPKDFALNYPHKHFNLDSVSSNFAGADRPFVNNKEDKVGKLKNKGDVFDMDSENTVQDGNWFEKRSAFRTEARKRYHEHLGNSSPNNSSWYFRRMRKREQCRAKRDRTPFIKVRKEKKVNK